METKTSSKIVRVMLVDDLAASRQTLKRALGFDDDIEVVGEAGSGTEAVELARSLRPDIVLMDVRMPDGDGVEATSQITQRLPRTKVVALTAYDDIESVRDMLAAGAIGYFLKGAPVDELLAIVRKAQTGEGQLDPRLLPTALDDLRRLLQEERDRRAEIERLSRLREEFIQVLSHELRTPLTVMTGALRFLQRRGLQPDETALVSSALSRAADFERLIEGLELVGEKGTGPSAKTNPARALRDAMDRLPEGPDAVDAVEETWAGVQHRHVVRVAYELISNAVKHGRRPVTVRAYRRGPEAVLEVANAGGFEPGPEMFDPFAQGDMSITRTQGGLGLGLFISKRLCESGGGTLEFRRDDERTVAEASFLLRR